MLSFLTYGPVGRPTANVASELDPGVISLVTRLVRSWRAASHDRHERSISNFIEASGGHMSDDIERRIGSGLAAGHF